MVSLSFRKEDSSQFFLHEGSIAEYSSGWTDLHCQENYSWIISGNKTTFPSVICKYLMLKLRPGRIQSGSSKMYNKILKYNLRAFISLQFFFSF